MQDRWQLDERITNTVPQVSHVRNGDGHLVGTVASIEAGDEYHVGVARCNPGEPGFSRKIGRKAASGRARLAMARKLGLTNRSHDRSRFVLSATIPQVEIFNFLREQGVNVPDERPANQE